MRLAVVGALGVLVACRGGTPPAWDAAAGASASAVPTALPVAPPAGDAATGDAATGDAATGDAATGAPGIADGGAIAVNILDAATASLPQNRDRPRAEGALHAARVAAFWQAIVEDDPDRAMPFFFPVGAYAQVKAVTHPEGDWKRRLVSNYVRDIHALHAELGKDPSACRFVALDVPDERARWVEPGEEYNKEGYYRVYGSRLRWETLRPDGSRRERTAPVSSLISWRGEWFIVHLTGFK